MLSALIPSQRRYPAMQLTPQPVHQRLVQPGPLVLRSDPLKLPTPITDRDRTVSRRSEPSSRATLIGEQPNPWDLLQPQDVTSRHRGQACLCYCTPRTVTKRTEHTFESLRYTFGGDHPSQTTHHALSPVSGIRHQIDKGWYFTVDSPEPSGPGSLSPTYPTHHLPNVNAKL